MKRVVTEATVRRAARSGRELAVGPDDLVTPAARDAARSLGVALVEPVARPAPTPERATFTVALGSDHGGFRLKESLKPTITELGLDLSDIGCTGTEPVDYPVFAARVAELVAGGRAQFGIMVDGAGIGSAMVANKIPGVRSALCYDLTTAKNAREHNDANLLALGGGLIGERLAADIVRTFLTTPFGGDRHARRVAMINALDQKRGP